MKVTGFSFIKNAVKMQYPIVEAIRSILPLCDEVIVAVGKSDDETRSLVAAIDKKVKILDTIWDENLKEGGRVLAAETDKAFKAIGKDTDWCIYIQGDEVLHEDGIEEVREAMIKWKDDSKVDGLLFKYRHFFGSYDFVGIESHWYRNEIRVIKNNKAIYSYKDAQGFRKGDHEKLNVKPVNAFIHHYGWVQNPHIMKAKQAYKEKLYRSGEYDETTIVASDDYAFTLVNALKKFKGTHPLVMKKRIDQLNWPFNYDEAKNKTRLKDKFKNLMEKFTGKRFFDYKNYKII
ncbi:MAG: glycosyltransferase family 2 protein [Ferruginibacter sp.]